MEKRNRIILITVISILGLLDLYSLMDMISKFDLITRGVGSYIETELGFIFIISGLIFIFSIPSIIFNFKILKPKKVEIETEIIDNVSYVVSAFLENKTLWRCNIILGLCFLILGIYLLYKVISYFRIAIDSPVSMIIFSLLFILLGVVIIRDCLKIKNDGNKK